MPHRIGTSQTHPLSPDPDVLEVIRVWDWTAKQYLGWIPTVQSKEGLYITKIFTPFKTPIRIQAHWRQGLQLSVGAALTWIIIACPLEKHILSHAGTFVSRPPTSLPCLQLACVLHVPSFKAKGLVRLRSYSQGCCTFPYPQSTSMRNQQIVIWKAGVCDDSLPEKMIAQEREQGCSLCV